jgi:hypothetical protein
MTGDEFSGSFDSVLGASFLGLSLRMTEVKVLLEAKRTRFSPEARGQ